MRHIELMDRISASWSTFMVNCSTEFNRSVPSKPPRKYTVLLMHQLLCLNRPCCNSGTFAAIHSPFKALNSLHDFCGSKKPASLMKIPPVIKMTESLMFASENYNNSFSICNGFSSFTWSFVSAKKFENLVTLTGAPYAKTKRFWPTWMERLFKKLHPSTVIKRQR